MGILEDVMKADAEFAFCNGDFSSSVTFQPNGSGPSRQVEASFIRLPPDESGIPRVASYKYLMSVRNHPIYGVTPDEAERGAKFIIPRDVGEVQEKELGIKGIERQDAAMLLLRVG